MSAISGVVASTGNIGGQNGPAEAKSLVEATLAEDSSKAQWYKAPLRMPDTAVMFPIGGNLNVTA